jgi:PAS domain S-box-containing protein
LGLNQFTRYAIDAHPHAIYWLAEDGVILYANYAACELVGYELEQTTGRYFDGEREAKANAQAYDADARRKLWQLSELSTG